jgi:DNA-damage-inducible protein D
MRQRVVEREGLARYRRALYKTARTPGVITPLDFAVFENHGYQGLYHETAEEILVRKGLRPTDNPADYMGVLETAANGFRVALANELLMTQPRAAKDRASSTHERAGGAVRKTMEDMGVPTPERPPTPAQSIQQVQRDLARQKRIEEEDRLGLWALMDDETQEGGDDA